MQPIGIFDSGIGGLVVARAVKELLPQETIVYFGDTAYLPYGDKDVTTIRVRTLQICDLFLQRRCKVILMACNSAAAAAYDVVCAYVGKRAAVLHVIDPMVAYIADHFRGQSIGLIGTRQTVNSGVYAERIRRLHLDITLKALATPLLAPMIEAKFGQAVSREIIYTYLQSPILGDIQALILACTHYPVIKTQIQAFYQHQLEVVDATHLTAMYLKCFMTRHQLLSSRNRGQDHFITSALTTEFEKATRIFFGQRIHLERHLA